MIQKIRQRIKPYAIGLGLLGLIGCAANQKTIKSQVSKPYATTSKFVDGTLRTMAGIYAGTVSVERIRNGYFAKGFYSQAMHPKAMDRVLFEADTNHDKIITRDEAINMARKLYKTHSK